MAINRPASIEEIVRQLQDGEAPIVRGKHWNQDGALIAAHQLLAREVIAAIPPYPDAFWGRGIVICAGGAKYFTPAWVCASMLRYLGCELPIQFWHLGEQELDGRMREMVAELDVTCVDAEELRRTRPARILLGWELKAYAILHSRFREVILFDADNVPLIDPAALFEIPEYHEHGAIFWPDYNDFPADHPIWSICEVEGRVVPQFESGQIVVDKRRCWAAMNLAMHYNEHSDFYYEHILGDKDTFHMAFRRVGKSFAMPATPVKGLQGTMCQHDFQGKRIFQHRNFDKWRLDGNNRRIPGFLYDDLCRRFIKELREKYNGRAEQKIAARMPALSDDIPGEAEAIQRTFRGAANGENASGFAVPFKMFGLQRTGTNIVRRGLLENFQVRSIEAETSWKHGPIGDIGWREWNGQLARVVVCVRNPYAWLASCFAYFRKSFRIDKSVCQNFSFETGFSEFVLGEHYTWPSPVERWNEMNWHWQSFVAAHPLRAAIVRAEDLLGIEEQARQWLRLESSLGLMRNYRNSSSVPDDLKVFDKRIDTANLLTPTGMDFGYYRQERYLAEYDGPLLQVVNDRLDWQLMDLFRYERREGGG